MFYYFFVVKLCMVVIDLEKIKILLGNNQYFYFPKVKNIIIVEIVIIIKVIHPMIFNKSSFVFSLRISLSLAIFIFRKRIGNDTTPLIIEA